MADDMQLGGWMESTRIQSTLVPDEAQRQAAQKRSARGNLAALVVERHGGLKALGRDKVALAGAAGEFADLADMLGLLGATERAPGTCAVCGRPLPTAWTTRIDSKAVRRDVCARRKCKEAAGG